MRPPSNLYLYLFPKKTSSLGFHVCPFPVITGGLSPPKLAPLSLEVGSFLGISMTCWDGNDNGKRRRGQRWPETNDGEMVWIELEKKGTYNVVRLKLALIGVYYGRISLVCCHCFLGFWTVNLVCKLTLYYVFSHTATLSESVVQTHIYLYTRNQFPKTWTIKNISWFQSRKSTSRIRNFFVAQYQNLW